MSVRTSFERYERVFEACLHSDADMDEAAALYAPAFIAASPAGVMTGKNDQQLRQVMAQGCARDRAIGTKEMRIRGLRISPIDDRHCVAHVAWRATYVGKDRPEVTIGFEVHSVVQQLAAQPRVFGWVSGDEQALSREHGII